MPIVRDKKTGKFVKGNSYWLNKKNKKANSGSFEKGSIPWNKGNKTYKNCEFCGKKFSTNKKKLTKPNQKFCSRKCFNLNQRGPYYGKKVYKMVEYKRWRLAVFKRDGNKCVECGSSHDLEADHIKPKSKFPELVFDVDNGRTLCYECHKKTRTYGRHK